MRILYCILLTISGIIFLSFTTPKGWHKAGSDRDSYDMGIDAGSGLGNSKAATIQSNTDRVTGFGTLMQNFRPGNYRGKKIRMTGYMKSYDVDGWAGFWLRIDGEPGTYALAFDNMQDRPIKGTTGWTKYEVVLNVSENAENIAFGALLVGQGKIWFDNIRFEEIAEPARKPGTIIYKDPVNLNFEE